MTQDSLENCGLERFFPAHQGQSACRLNQQETSWGGSDVMKRQKGMSVKSNLKEPCSETRLIIMHPLDTRIAAFCNCP